METLGDWYYVLLSIGIVITIGVVIAVIYYSRREFKKTLEEIQKKKIANDYQNDHGIEFPVPLNENIDDNIDENFDDLSRNARIQNNAAVLNNVA